VAPWSPKTTGNIRVAVRHSQTPPSTLQSQTLLIAGDDDDDDGISRLSDDDQGLSTPRALLASVTSRHAHDIQSLQRFFPQRHRESHCQ
jgi:hypothetical protein